MELYLYEYFPQSHASTFVDPVSIRVLVDPIGYTFGRITMSEPTSLAGPSIPVATTPALSTLSMFTTSPESHLYGGPSVPPGYQSLSRTFSGASSNPWTSPMSSSSTTSGKYIVIIEWLDPLYTSSGKYQAGPFGYIPSSTILTGLPTFGEQYFPSYYTPHIGGKPMVTHFL